MRDLRDPQALGEAYLKARKLGSSIEDAASMPVPQHLKNPTTLDKYGRPGDHEPVWEKIQIK